MREKQIIVVFDFDGFLINSYDLISHTFKKFGLDIGDENRFRNRRKFLKYIGGGKEILRNFVAFSLPNKRRFRKILTDEFMTNGRIYPEFQPILNQMIENPLVHVGIVSRNFTNNPGRTIRTILGNSGVKEQYMDFVIPISIGSKKTYVLEAMKSSQYQYCLFGGDEISDYKSAQDAGYKAIMASYGFDHRQRLMAKGGVPEDDIFDNPKSAVDYLEGIIASVASQ